MGRMVEMSYDLHEVSKDDLVDTAVAIYKEISKRISEGKMNYSVSEDKSPAYEKLWEEVSKKLTKEEIDILTGKTEKSLKPQYTSRAKPAYRFYFEELSDNLKKLGWDNEKILVDTKWDGLRMTVGKINGKGFAFVDPEGLKKKSPNISDRIPAIIKEMEDKFPDNTVLDAEFLALHPNKKEMLHRTVANSLLNSKVSGEELEKYAIIFIFDVLYYEGQDIRDQPLHERLEYLSRLKDTKHIWIERISTSLSKKADGYIVKGSEAKKIQKIAEIFRGAKNGRPKYASEGIMIKRLNHPYECPQNKGWAKTKYYHELDLRIIEKKTVKGTKNVYNYYLGYDIPKEYATAYLDMTTKDWYGIVKCFKDGKIIATGKDCKDYLNKEGYKFIAFMGKSDNSKETTPLKVGDILRIAAEEVLKFENSKNPKYPRYSFYIGRVLEPIPEKNVTDSIAVIDKLSSFEPKRIPIDELKHIKEMVEKSMKITKSQILEWVEEGKIPKDVYKSIAKDNQPLPKDFYVDYDEGIAWAQMHIRGLNPEDTKAYKSGKLSFVDLIDGHSIHVDLRMKFKKRFIQWVITQDKIKDYFDTIIGRIDSKTGNVSKGLAIVKPSAEEPTKTIKKSKEDELIISKEDAKKIEEYVLFNKSYIIPAGEVGSTAYKDAFMCTIWLGNVKAGLQREDAHEYFLSPNSEIPDKNKELFNGRFIVRAFKADKDKRWWIWKATNNPKPLDPIEHADTGHYYPIPADKIKEFGRERHRDESKRKYVSKLK